MKKLLVLSLALLFVGAMGGAAMAGEPTDQIPPCATCVPVIDDIEGPSIQVYALIEKDKNILVCEDVDIFKDVYIDVDVDEVYGKAAESLALAEQVNENNEACENCAEKKSTIRNSITNVGVTTVNQATGNMNNQGNLLALGVDGGTAGPGAFANAEASAHQDVLDNTIDSTNIFFRDSLIQNSVNDNEGITFVNQAAGQGNNQLNAAAIAVALEGAVSLSEADLGQTVLDSTVTENYAYKSALITGSVNTNSGVTFTNQSSGNSGNQANNLSFAYATAP